MSNDFEIDLGCFDLEEKSFTYYVFDGSSGCDDCQDHSTATPCDPPERPHPSCDCDIVSKEFKFGGPVDLRCELVSKTATVEPGEPHTAREATVLYVPAAFERYVQTRDPQELEDEELRGFETAPGVYDFRVDFQAKVGRYIGGWDDGDGDGDDDGDGDGDDDGEDGGGDGDGGGGLCEDPGIEEEDSGTRDGTAMFSTDADEFTSSEDLERSRVVIEYATQYTRWEIVYRLSVVITVGDQEIEQPVLDFTQIRTVSSGVFVSDVYVEHR